MGSIDTTLRGDGDLPTPPDIATEDTQPEAPTKSFMDIVKAVISSPAMIPGVICFIGIVIAFWPLLIDLRKLWFEGDGYYSHGVLVPFISGWIIYKWWPWLSKIEVAKKPQWVALVPMLITGWVLFAGTRIQQDQILSVALVTTILWAIWFVAGFRWMLGLSLPVLYLFFMLPVWTSVIDNYTNPLQVISTEVSYGLLQIFQFEVMKTDNTTIHMNRFILDVGVPCSGLKLVLAVTAFNLFFIAIGRMKWYANLMMLATVIPLCLAINGLRIALIGVVGETWGADAGHQFHDYSGYITLLVCFFILFKFARFLGWKD